MQPPNDEVRKNTEDEEGYKCLNLLETDRFKNLEMKEKVRKEYFLRKKKILKSKLISGIVVKTINSSAVALVRYDVELIRCIKYELGTTERKTRKQY